MIINQSTTYSKSNLKQSRLSTNPSKQQTSNVQIDDSIEGIIQAIIDMKGRTSDSLGIANAIHTNIQAHGDDRFAFFLNVCRTILTNHQNKVTSIFVFLAYLRNPDQIHSKYEYLIIINVASMNVNKDKFEQNLRLSLHEFQLRITSYLFAIATFIIEKTPTINSSIDVFLSELSKPEFEKDLSDNPGLLKNISDKITNFKSSIQIIPSMKIKDLENSNQFADLVFYSSFQRDKSSNINTEYICKNLFTIYRCTTSKKTTIIDWIDYSLNIDLILMAHHRLTDIQSEYKHFTNKFGESINYIDSQKNNDSDLNEYIKQFYDQWHQIPESIIPTDNETVLYRPQLEQYDEISAPELSYNNDQNITKQMSALNNLNEENNTTYQKSVLAGIIGSVSVLYLIFEDVEERKESNTDNSKSKQTKNTLSISTATSDNSTPQPVNPNVSQSNKKNNNFIFDI
jgi:hypothetical protein